MTWNLILAAVIIQYQDLNLHQHEQGLRLGDAAGGLSIEAEIGLNLPHVVQGQSDKCSQSAEPWAQILILPSPRPQKGAHTMLKCLVLLLLAMASLRGDASLI